LVGITEKLFSSINSWLYNLRKINMRSLNIDLLQLVSTAVAAGALTVDELNYAVANPRELRMPCGFAKDDHNQFYAVFFATEKEDPTQIIRSKPEQEGGRGLRVKLNIRAQKQKTQIAQSPGQVLPAAPVGVPVLTNEQIAGVGAALKAAANLQASVLKGTPPKVRQATQPTHVDPDTDIPF